jgi:hypothetical protein
MSHNPHQHEDLAWEAFLYASGEMNAAEMARFEERLASEQPAREALAAAVELAQATSSAIGIADVVPVTPARKQSPQKFRSWVWVALGGAACLAAAASITLLGLGHRQQPNQSELAARWSEVRELNQVSLDGETGEPFEIESFATEAYEDAEVQDGPEGEEEQLATAPDWMLAAVVGLRDEQQMDDEQRVDPPLEQ